MTQFPACRAGIFISGGLDSALLYYLLLKENKNVTPLLVVKNQNQQKYAIDVITYVQELHKVAISPRLLKNTDIKLAAQEAIDLGFTPLYFGVIKELDEFLVDWESNNFVENKWIKGPLKDFDKSEIVKMIIENKIEHLFSITHSCAKQSQGRCGVCNRCRERAWAFSQLGLTDPGTI